MKQFLFALSFSIVSIVNISSSTLLAQHAFLDLFHPNRAPFVTLRTDSLFIQIIEPDGSQTSRFIRYQYNQLQSPVFDWTEIRKTGAEQKIYRIRQTNDLFDIGNLVETATLDSSTMQETRERTFIFGSDPVSPDSLIQEIWDSTYWRPLQKTLLLYSTGQKLTRRTELYWKSGEWINSAQTVWQYDEQKRLLERQNRVWENETWVAQSAYYYTYKASGLLPVSSIWKTRAGDQLLPVDSTAAWYDGQDLPDSSVIFLWNAGASNWYILEKTEFIDTEQKKAGQGNKYRFDGSGEWQLAETPAILAGEGIYTDEPFEVVQRMVNTSSPDIWEERRRETTWYQPLYDGRVFGTIQVHEVDESLGWQEVFHAEAWFHKVDAPLLPDSIGNRSVASALLDDCGLYNPYVHNQSIALPQSDAEGRYEVEIFNGEGRLVHRQFVTEGNQVALSAVLLPGFYLVKARKGSTPVCIQKLIVK